MTTQTQVPHLLSSVQIGDLNLKNRVAMAPLTRARAGVERIPNQLMAKYYSQRASSGLIVSEATSISPQGNGWQIVLEFIHQHRLQVGKMWLKQFTKQEV